MVLSHDSSLSGTVVAAYLLNTSISILFQGLAALYEKEDDPKLKAELPEVYTKLLHMYERYSVCTYCSVWIYWMSAFLFPCILYSLDGKVSEDKIYSKSVSLELLVFSFFIVLFYYLELTLSPWLLLSRKSQKI